MRGSRFSWIVLTAIAVPQHSAFCGTARAQSEEEIDALNEQVSQLAQEGKWAEALDVAERMVPMTLKFYGEYSDWHAAALNNVASNNEELGRLTTAEPFFLHAIAIADKMSEGKGVHFAMSLDNLGNLYREMGRYQDAEPLYRRSIAILEKHRRDEPEALATAVTGLGVLYYDQDRYPEAEQLHRTALAIEEKAGNAASTATSLNNLATTLEKEGRKEEAEALYLRALKMTRSALGDAHPAMVTRYNNLAEFYRATGRLEAAEPMFKKAMAVAEASLGRDHPEVALTGSNLARVYADLKRYPEAEELYKRAITVTEAAWGPDHPQISTRLYNLATLYVTEGRTKEAEPLLQRALKLKEATGVEDDRGLEMNLELLADVGYAQQQWESGLEFARRAARIVTTRAGRYASTAGAKTRDNPRAELTSGTGSFVRVLEGAWHVAQQKPAEQAALSEEAFQAEQWSTETAAATALAMLAAREGSGNPQLAALARQREDLAEQWRGVDTTLVLASAAADRISQREKDALRKQLAEFDKKIASLDAQIAKDFSNYAALTRPSAISTDEVKALIQPNEAVVQFARVGDDLYTWLITKDRVDWKLAPDKATDLDKRMNAFLCGLDDSWWLDDEELCKSSVTAQYSVADVKAGKQLPFDLANAYAIYQALFGQIEPELKNPDGTWRHLIIIPDAFPALSFAALVTVDPQGSFFSHVADYHTAKWLGTRQPISVLPSVTNLKALRAVAKPASAPRAFIGFGNPLLDGNPAMPFQLDRAKLARPAELRQRTPREHGRGDARGCAHVRPGWSRRQRAPARATAAPRDGE